MKPADKRAYDKDYKQAKATGKPFFPYAIYKDTIVAGLAILGTIILAMIVKVMLYLAMLTTPNADTTAMKIGWRIQMMSWKT